MAYQAFQKAIEAIYPDTEIQLCIVHMVRNSWRYVVSKDYKEVCADLKQIYGAATLEGAEAALSDFSEKWGNRYPSISAMWKRDWERIIPFFNIQTIFERRFIQPMRLNR